MKRLSSKAIETKIERDNRLLCFYPKPKYPAVSLTGERCAFDCDYCKGKYLKDMEAIDGPENLYEFCKSLDEAGGHGILLSGGYNEDGYVSIEPYLETISQIKEDTDLFLSAHVGLPPKDLVRKIGKSGIDKVDFDFVDNESTIKNKIDQRLSKEDYRKTLEILLAEIPHVSPHVILGLSGSRLVKEMKAIKYLSAYDFSALVLLVLIPPSNWGIKIPNPERIRRFVARTRLNFPEVPISLGCMRPKQRNRTEIEKAAVESGIDQIVLPSKKTKKMAEDLGLNIEEVAACCSVPEKVVERWKDG